MANKKTPQNSGEEDIHDLLAELSDDNPKKEAKTESNVPSLSGDQYNSKEALAQTLYIFVENQLQSIQEQESFRSIVVEELIDRVKEQQVDVGDLLRLYEVISKQKRDSTSSILNLFKSNQGDGAIFNTGEGAESSEKEYETLTTKERVAIDRLSRLLGSSKLSD